MCRQMSFWDWDIAIIRLLHTCFYSDLKEYLNMGTLENSVYRVRSNVQHYVLLMVGLYGT